MKVSHLIAVVVLALIFSGCNTQDSPTDEEIITEYLTAGDEIPVLCPQIDEYIDSVTMTASQEGYQRKAGAFAFSLLDLLYSGKSMVFSPFSLQMALSLLVNGADDDSRHKILDILGFNNVGLDALNVYSKTLLDQLPALDSSVQLGLANAVFANKQVHLYKSYKDVVSSNYYASVENLDFLDIDTVEALVNEWCSKHTHGIVPVILDKGLINPNTLAVLINALYFKAEWNDVFKSGFIWKDQKFKAADGTITNVDYLRDSGLMFYIEMKDYTIVKKTFGDRQKFEMTLFLPKKDGGIKAMLEEMKKLDWPLTWGDRESRPMVSLQIPKFVTTSNHDLLMTLSELGLPATGFGKLFEDVSRDNIEISKIIQKASIDLNENGVEAAAATEIIMEYSSSGETIEYKYFIADHPFAYVLSEVSSGTILFAGVFDGLE